MGLTPHNAWVGYATDAVAEGKDPGGRCQVLFDGELDAALDEDAVSFFGVRISGREFYRAYYVGQNVGPDGASKAEPQKREVFGAMPGARELPGGSWNKASSFQDGCDY